MITKPIAFWGLILLMLLTSCIQVELKDEREFPSFYEIALITHTPSGQITEQDTPTATLTPAATGTIQPSPTPTTTQTEIPPSPTPTQSAVVSMNAYCRQGPGTKYPGIDYLITGELVTLLGRDPAATWWLIQKSAGTESCWVSAVVISLLGEYPDLTIVTAPPTPFQRTLPEVSPTQKPRQKPPKPTEGVPPSPTDTPKPYPYPEP